MFGTIKAKLLSACFLLCLVDCGAHAHGNSFTFELPDREKMCFEETFEGPVGYVFEYRVIRGGNNDVDAYVVSPNGKILYKQRKHYWDRFTFETSRGDFKFCFSNQFSTITHKVVYFQLRPQDLDTLQVESGRKKPTVNTASEASCDNIHESMTSVVEHQRDYRLREAVGRHIAEGLRQKVTWWSIGQAVVIFITGFGQVLVLKKFFTERLESKPEQSA